ncbi:interferon-induced very large GTPase 1-like isoform X2 [Poecilia latipinna]|uniref:interferon-induced very large GTPase 1-like isoform X2 n=1 Tax=Poecilia latipinna TaxID=48699 RepID=UPI00072DB04E|nr:PREDICTED: interferon-induced very large GTPase 1-like isoform X2 [Poecilia latipinna]
MEASAATDVDKTDADLIIVLFGDTSSVESGTKNILINQDEHTEFSSKLYDLCGRHIYVINLIGLRDIKEITLDKGINAFLLLISYGHHVSQYKSGLQWLEKTFGRGAIYYLMTVLTHNSGEKYEDAFKDLKVCDSFVEKRYHTCTRSMSVSEEIAELLLKIQAMESDSNPSCFTGLICGGNKEQNKDLEPESVGHNLMESSVVKKKQTGEEVQKSAAEREDPAIELSEENHNDNAAMKTGTSAKSSGQNGEKSQKDLDKIVQNSQHQRETQTLLTRLQLQDEYPRKMSPGKFLQVGPPLKLHQDTSEKDLAYSFLHRLIMLDYRARYIPVEQDSLNVTCSKPVLDSDGNDSDESDLESFMSAGVGTNQPSQTHVHPMDVQMAVFHCSDNFLRQIMITKLSQCQYALPLLVPDPFTAEIECPLWAFRQITKTWKVTKGDSQATMKNIPICKAETPLVSFFRLGSLSVSKSQLMNSLINDRHSTFFHRHCPGSTKTRLLLDGVAEITWYCPAGKPGDAFNNCIAFCNLHGDAVMIEKQRDILMEKSSVNVVMVPNLQKDDGSRKIISALWKSKKPLICLLVDDDGAVESRKGKYKMGLKARNQADVSVELKRIIQGLLSSEDPSILKTTFQLETMMENSEIKVDESDNACQNGKSAAVTITNLFQNRDVSSIKDDFLSYQGHLWLKWCKANKELHRLTGNIENDKSKKERELTRIRGQQCDISCSELMRLFTKNLFILPPKDKEYFLKWTQILTDALSADCISSILQSYDNKWSEVMALRNNHDKSKHLEKMETELELLSKKLQSATFGLEHIFREMGQIYEAHKTKHGDNKSGNWCSYPKLAADLLISGHPLELLDGDAGHVPLRWISSVFDEVIRKLGDLKVFVLSVLGLQSSGKSTMMNSMFGLQFAVSAGRCTKGAFMQLVKMTEEVKKDIKFDYLLVVDTEGLRALELESTTLQHDNELATFVVGVGNMTLINIFGENPAEMQDILQIVVQASMRMKKIRLSPSCVFVHQNVTDVAAAEKNMDGRRRLQEKLDQMTQLAAKEEDCSSNCFGDVITFNIETDVKYFAQLWEGSPPMAPPNPGYSESIQELKAHILSKASASNGISLSHLKVHIQDLWDALLNENFVFSFKNTQEIAEYRKLEAEYGNWTWAIRDNLLTIENQLYNRIENGDLNQLESSSISTETSKAYEEIEEAMIRYFEEEKNKETLVQWRGRFECKLKEFHDEQVGTVKRKLDGVIRQKSARKMMDDMKTEFENKLLQKSKDIAQNFKNKSKEEAELQQAFNTDWKIWVNELTKNTKPLEDIELDNDLFVILKEIGMEEKLIKECKESGTYKDISKTDKYVDYINILKKEDLNETSGKPQSDETENNVTNKQTKSTNVKNVWKAVLKQYFKTPKASSVDQIQIKQIIDIVAKESVDTIKKKPVATRGYQSTYLHEMVHFIKENVAMLESELKYAFVKKFTVDLVLYVFDLVKSWLLESQQKFKLDNDALCYLESRKMHYYNIFQICCKGSSSVVVLGELICEKLRPSIAEAAYTKTALALARDMKCNVPAFSGNRLNLEKHVLRSLAEREEFEEFIVYFQNPREQIEAFITAEVQRYIDTGHNKAEIILQQNVEDIYTVVSQALCTATEKVKIQRGDINAWLSELSLLMKDQLKFDSASFKDFSDIHDFDFLSKETDEKLKSVKEQISSFSVHEMKKSRETPEQILIDQLCRCCWVKCPFCSAVCTNTLEDHSPDDHSVPFHRSCSLSGMYHANTRVMYINFCTSDVSSDRTFLPNRESKRAFPYKEYRKAGPEFKSWRITPDESKLPYWKWVVCRFRSNLEKYYGLKFEGLGKIPENWKEIRKEEAIKSLDEMCQ